MHPFIILAIGIAVVIGMILFLRINAFIALITAAIVVSLLAPGSFSGDTVRVVVTPSSGDKFTYQLGKGKEVWLGTGQACEVQVADPALREKHCLLGYHDGGVYVRPSGAEIEWGGSLITGEVKTLPANSEVKIGGTTVSFPGELKSKIARVAQAFGSSAGGIAIVIALAAVIGNCMMDSGAADRIVRSFLKVLGEERAPMALMGSGFVLSVPVFFDTVFYLLVPLARSLYKRTGKQYLRSLLAIAAGGAITHTLVPPTPGPLFMAENLGIDLGVMIMVGTVVALPAALVGLLFARIVQSKIEVPFREIAGVEEQPPLEDDRLPSLFLSLLPVVIPVALIAMNTVVGTLVNQLDMTSLSTLQGYTSIVGNPNFAMLAATAFSLWLVQRQRKMTLNQLSQVVETALMSAGTIILITAGGGAFGGMLKVAEIGTTIQATFEGQDAASSGMTFLLLGYAIAVLLKVAQGSSTVAMITTSGMMAAMVGVGGEAASSLGFNPVYLATSIGAGSLMGSWMNDSGFWIFTKMGGLTEPESLKTWTPLLALLSLASLVVTIALAMALPLNA